MASRRTFIRWAGASALAAMSRVDAAEPVRLAWLSAGYRSDTLPFLDALRTGLAGLGYAEGRNLSIDARWGEDIPARVEAHAREIVASSPNIIVSLGPAAFPLARHTSTIPIVFGFSGDPVRAGFVQSFARPGGNLTGVSFLALDLIAKRIDLLKTATPNLKRVAVVASTQHPGDQAERRVSETVAAGLGIAVEYFEWQGPAKLDETLAAIQRSGCGAALLFPITPIIAAAPRIAAWSMQTRIPTISGWSRFAEQGNLMSYGADLIVTFRRLAEFVVRILDGAKPGEIPVELPRQVELVVNARAARGLGLTLPKSLLLRADRIVE